MLKLSEVSHNPRPSGLKMLAKFIRRGIRDKDTFWCDGCGIEIRWEPVTIDDLIYCCRECSEGIQCQCEEIEEEFTSPEQITNYPINSTS